MRRVYWDTMLLIYLLEGHPQYSMRVEELLRISLRRNDSLFTSFLGLGEAMVGAVKKQSVQQRIRIELDSIGFNYLPFEAGSVEVFAHLRAAHKVKALDAAHLACAGAANVDLFLTGDQKLLKLHVPGIKFIADFDTSLLSL